MKHLFLSHELAIIAKEKGFSDPCVKGVKDGHEFTTTGFNLTNHGNTHDFTLPIYQQIVDWMRKKHQIIIAPPHICKNDYYTATWSIENSVGGSIKKFKDQNYFRAYEMAIKDALESI